MSSRPNSILPIFWPCCAAAFPPFPLHTLGAAIYSAERRSEGIEGNRRCAVPLPPNSQSALSQVSHLRKGRGARGGERWGSAAQGLGAMRCTHAKTVCTASHTPKQGPQRRPRRGKRSQPNATASSCPRRNNFSVLVLCASVFETSLPWNAFPLPFHSCGAMPCVVCVSSLLLPQSSLRGCTRMLQRPKSATSS